MRKEVTILNLEPEEFTSTTNQIHGLSSAAMLCAHTHTSLFTLSRVSCWHGNSDYDSVEGGNKQDGKVIFFSIRTD